ncbi:MAG: tRNA threonylcarbamoyladenosine biosynthesis protein RimN [Methylococcaceae bacterium]|nr:MAG: tRNA threonylcarbamoyladenosine biosynthesis protein RimN [Methylococcaceae bacterium]
MLTPWQLRLTVRRLNAGGIIAHPTEAVYGLGCDPCNERAVQRLLALKTRPAHKGLILLAGDFVQIQPYLNIPPERYAQLLSSWPGPVTWVVPASSRLPSWLGVDGTIAVRVTAHPLSAALCRAFGGPLISTSANPGGKRPARDALSVRRYFPEANVLIVHGTTGGAARPSAIYDAVSGARLR